MATLSEIEKQIAELENEVIEEEEQDNEIIISDINEEEEEDLLPIPPLPPEQLPPLGLLLGSAKKKSEKEDDKRIECKSCKQVFIGRIAFRKHCRTLKHKQNVDLRAGESYEPIHEANYCRACNQRFNSPEELLTHRQTDEHKDANGLLNRASRCSVCDKQFTSPLQLREHVKGKQHSDMVELKTGYRPDGRVLSNKEKPLKRVNHNQFEKTGKNETEKKQMDTKEALEKNLKKLDKIVQKPNASFNSSSLLKNKLSKKILNQKRKGKVNDNGRKKFKKGN